MAIGKTIKRIRNMRGMTQKELGLALGFDDNTADIRVAQYEVGDRMPKAEMLKNIADNLQVNYKFLITPDLSDIEELIYSLLHLDDTINIDLQSFVQHTAAGKSIRHIGFILNSKELDEFLKEWASQKDKLNSGIITQNEYEEWKIKFSYDDCKNKKQRYKLKL